MANPRKFSEKIALHNKKQAEETAAFEAVLREISATTQVCLTFLLALQVAVDPEDIIILRLGKGIPVLMVHHRDQF